MLQPPRYLLVFLAAFTVACSQNKEQPAPPPVTVASNQLEEAGPPKSTAVIPEFARQAEQLGNASGNESGVFLLCHQNHALEESLHQYDSDSVREELEKRFLAETPSSYRWYLAAVAARWGSEHARHALEGGIKQTAYATSKNVLDALGHVLQSESKHPPGWAVELARKALADERPLTGLEEANISPNPALTVAYVADEDAGLTRLLGQSRVVEAIPQLVNMAVRENSSTGAIVALSEIGGTDAENALLEVLARHVPRDGHEMVGNAVYERVVRGLGRMRSQKATPLLLKYLNRDSIEALGEIGNVQAITPLEKFVRQGRGRAEDLATARIVLVALKEPSDPVPGYIKLLNDPAVGPYQRREIVGRLSLHPDVRGVQVYVDRIKHDPSGAVVNTAIQQAPKFRYPEMITGLIDCFDAHFDGKDDWKRATNPEDFRRNIASSLHRLTGVDLGPDAEKWRSWLKTNGPKLSSTIPDETTHNALPKHP